MVGCQFQAIAPMVELWFCRGQIGCYAGAVGSGELGEPGGNFEGIPAAGNRICFEIGAVDSLARSKVVRDGRPDEEDYGDEETKIR